MPIQFLILTRACFQTTAVLHIHAHIRQKRIMLLTAQTSYMVHGLKIVRGFTTEYASPNNRHNTCSVTLSLQMSKCWVSFKCPERGNLEQRPDKSLPKPPKYWPTNILYICMKLSVFTCIMTNPVISRVRQVLYGAPTTNYQQCTYPKVKLKKMKETPPHTTAAAANPVCPWNPK